MLKESKITPKVESELLLNLKDISKLKSGNAAIKSEDKAITIDATIEKYNKKYTKAMEAPVPKVNLLYNEVLLRAVPKEIKSKSGLIISLGEDQSDYSIAHQLNRMTHAVSMKQEILMVGSLVTDEEQQRGMCPGSIAKINLKKFRSLHDRSTPGVIEHEYEIPLEVIDGYEYILVDKRDILYTYK